MKSTHHHRAPLISASSSSSSSSPNHSFVSRLLLLLTLLPVSLACLAFILQWRGGGLADPASASVRSSTSVPGGSDLNHEVFPGMETVSSVSPKAHQSSSDCSNLARSSSPSFPYYGDWKFGVDTSLKPKVILNSHDLKYFDRSGLPKSILLLNLTPMSYLKSTIYIYLDHRDLRNPKVNFLLSDLSL